MSLCDPSIPSIQEPGRQAWKPVYALPATADTIRLSLLNLLSESERSLTFHDHVRPATRAAYVALARVAAQLHAAIPGPPAMAPPVADTVAHALAPVLHHEGWCDGEDPVRAALGRFHRDLAYLGLIEAGGLAAVNARLDAWLAELRAADSGGAAPRLAERIDDLLHRAIYLFPHLATSVAVELERDDHAAEAAFQGRASELLRHRATFQTVLHASAAPGDTLGRAAYPLPYVFAGAGDAERRARLASFDDVQCHAPLAYERRDREGRLLPGVHLVPAHLRLCVGVAPVSEERFYAGFLLSEVRRLYFAEDLHFPPFHVPTLPKERSARPQAVMHYLAFRDFGDIGHSAAHAALFDLPALAHESLLCPDFATSLLDVRVAEDGEWLERGFGYLARPHADPARTELWRFDDVRLAGSPAAPPSPDHAALQVELYRAVLDTRHAWRANLRVFHGRHAIAELARVPPAPRRFGA